MPPSTPYNNSVRRRGGLLSDMVARCAFHLLSPTHTYVPNVTDRMLWLLQGMFPDARTDVGGNRHFERVSGA